MPDPIPGRPYSRLPIPQRLEKAHGALLALAEDPEIIAEMSRFGFGPEGAHVAQGNALYTAAEAAFTARVRTAGIQLEETADLGEAYAAAYARYGELAAVAEAAFADEPATLAALGLDGPYPARQADRLDRFQQFSAGARDPARLPAFVPYELKAADFDAFDRLVQAFDDALHDAGGSRGDAQHTGATKKERMRLLDRWMGQMHRIARKALRGKPQLLEKLGLVVR